MFHPYNHELQVPLTPDRLDRLSESLRTHGQTEIVLVRVSRTPDRAEILLGEATWQAAQHAQLPTIAIHYRKDLDGADDQARRIVEADHIYRTATNPYDHAMAVAHLFADLLMPLPYWEHIHPHLSDDARRAWAFVASWARNASPTTRSNLAVKIGCDERALERQIDDITYALDAGTLRSLTTNRGGLLDLSDEVRDALQNDRIQYKHALELRRIPEHTDRRRLLDLAVAGASVRVLKRRVGELLQRPHQHGASSHAQADTTTIRNLARDTHQASHKARILTHNQRQAVLAALRKAQGLLDQQR